MNDNMADFLARKQQKTDEIVNQITEESKRQTPITTREEFLFDYFGKQTGLVDLGERKLNLGCGREQRLRGFENLDRVDYPEAPVDYVFNLEGLVDNPDNPFHGDTYDFILASHVLEHINFLPDLMRELHRILKPGGFLGICCPYASSDDAWEDPTHVRAFTERSWMYFDRDTYAGHGHPGTYDAGVDYKFELVRVDMVPSPLAYSIMGRLGPDKLPLMIKQYRNMVQEMFATLKAVK
jgi:SAM-dependent methyltransferase